MHRYSDPADAWRAGEPAAPRGSARREAVVGAAAVIAVTAAALSAAVMQSRVPARDAAPTGASAPCAQCGVVETVVAVPDAQQAGYQVRVRMDDGSVRVVRQSAAVAAGERVVLGGGSARPLVSRARHG